MFDDGRLVFLFFVVFLNINSFLDYMILIFVVMINMLMIGVVFLCNIGIGLYRKCLVIWDNLYVRLIMLNVVGM